MALMASSIWIGYGTKWFKQNLDARLVRIDFNKGNRPPIAQVHADKKSGAVPLVVNFSALGSTDPDGDKMTYELAAGGKTHQSPDGNFAITFDKAEAIDASLTVKDAKGASSSAVVRVVAGNEAPIDICRAPAASSLCANQLTVRALTAVH